MRLNHVTLRTAGDAVRLVGEVESSSSWTPPQYELYFEFPARYREFVSVSADPFAVALLVPSMFLGESLEIVPPIAPRLLFQLARTREIFHVWFPELRNIDIDARARQSEPRIPSNRAAAFFSGGVDSFYTLLKYRGRAALPAPLTHSIFIKGIEAPLERLQRVEESQKIAEDVAAAVGVDCIVGVSNIRDYFPRAGFWEYYYYGSGLASVALSLSAGFDYVCIPSGVSYTQLFPHGSSPMIDERYSTDHLQIVHDGCEATRAQKIARSIEWDRDVFLKHVRVCLRNFGAAHNCGECYKCVRTSIVLRILGELDRALTFPNKSSRHWRRVARADHIEFLAENAKFAREHGSDPALTRMLERMLRHKRISKSVREFLESSPFARVVPRKPPRTLLPENRLQPFSSSSRSGL